MIDWTYHPAKSTGSFHQCESYRGYIEYEDARILVVIIFSEYNTWFVSIEDTLNTDEFLAVHKKLQELLSTNTNEHSKTNK